MIFDRTGQFSSAQPVTASVASTNVFDSGNPGTVLGEAAALRRDLGKGNPLPLTIRCVQAFNNLTSFQISYQVADDAAFTTNLTTVAQSPTYTLAQMAPGKVLLQPSYVPEDANRRYHRLFYTVTGTAPTVGQITAGFTAGNQSNALL